MQTLQVTLLPAATYGFDCSPIEIDYIKLSGLIQHDVVGIEIGMIDTLYMEMTDGTAHCQPLHLFQWLSTEQPGDGAGIGDALGHDVGGIQHAMTNHPGGDRFRYRQIEFAHILQQMQFLPGTGGFEAGPEITVRQPARDQAAAMIMSQHQIPILIVHEEGGTPAFGKADDRIALRPVCRIEGDVLRILKA